MKTRKNNDVLGNDELQHVWLGEMEFAESCGGKKRLSVVLDDHIERRNHGAVLANQVLHVKPKGERYIVQTANDEF